MNTDVSDGHNVRPMKVIGILGGSSDQATADYYRLINRTVNSRFGGSNTGDVLISSMNFALAEHFVSNALWTEAGQYLAARAQGLERAGAQLLICGSNTLHRVADFFTSAVSIPFLHIADPTGDAIRAAGLTRVGLLGTKPVMSTDFLQSRYREKFSLDVLVPEQDHQDALHRIIFDELCHAVITEPSKRIYLEAIDNLARRGAEGIILGCTEIRLLISQADRASIPFFDTLQLHVQAAVQFAIQT